MPGFGDTTFIVLLALLLFGPKKLPVLARQFGKLMADFRRASNEFKTQMEEELRISEQAERQKQIAAIEASAPQQAIPEPEHPHLPAPPNEAEPATSGQAAFLEASAARTEQPAPVPSDTTPPEPLPIATSGDLNLMPPATGLPVGRGASAKPASTLEDEAAAGHSHPAHAETAHAELEPAHVPSAPQEHAPAEPEARPWMI